MRKQQPGTVRRLTEKEVREMNKAVQSPELQKRLRDLAAWRARSARSDFIFD